MRNCALWAARNCTEGFGWRPIAAMIRTQPPARWRGAS